MRILMIVSRYGDDPASAGGDVQGALYARLWTEAGHDVTYLTSGDGEEDRDGVRVVRLGRTELLPLNAYRYYRKHGRRFNIVYSEAFGGARFPFCAPLYVKLPLITPWYQINKPVFVHELGRLLGTAAGAVEHLIARLHDSAIILTPSELRRTDLIDYGFRSDRVFALPPVAIEETEPGLPSVQRDPSIVWLGKVRRYKCPHDAIEAMPRVLDEVPGARLTIAGRRGEKGYTRELHQRTRELGIEQSVQFRFDISEDEKRDLLTRARALVVTSPVEGFGIVILEAAALGTPSVVSDGVPEEVVSDLYNGLRYPFGETAALSNRLIEMLSADSLHSGLAANAISHARDFTRESLASRLEETLAAATDLRRSAEAPAA